MATVTFFAKKIERRRKKCDITFLLFPLRFFYFALKVGIIAETSPKVSDICTDLPYGLKNYTDLP